MAPPAACRPLYLCEMMQRIGIEPGGGVVARLSLSTPAHCTAAKRAGPH
jgi:hypothetical protein